MPSRNKPLSDAELEIYEESRDLAADILQSIKEMKAGQVKPVDFSAIEARMGTGLSQSQFAKLLGVSVRTLQGWEQGRKHPSGAAKTLLAIAKMNPSILLAVAKNSRAN
jgi:putative transcriptional regulator